MGRKSKYETHVRPYLRNIAEWYKTMTEEQIARTLGISQRAFENYKTQYSELQECLKDSKQQTITELKSKLKQKAMGYEYTETKTTIRKDDNDKEVKVIEQYKRYAHPDTGAIHLLLKNLDSTWHNDDSETLEIKKKQIEIAQKKADNAEW